MMNRFTHLAALAGMVGPSLFGVVVTALTVAEYDFMRGLGWEPLSMTTEIWPSGLALGPYGHWMTAAFLVNGLLVAFFALGLGGVLPVTIASRVATALLFFSGLAMMGLASPTDAGHTTPATVHGRIHDLCFATVGFTLFPSMLALAWSFRRSARWRGLSVYTWATTALAVPTFAFKGAAFYAFLVAVLTWTGVVARRLKKVAAGVERS